MSPGDRKGKLGCIASVDHAASPWAFDSHRDGTARLARMRAVLFGNQARRRGREAKRDDQMIARGLSCANAATKSRAHAARFVRTPGRDPSPARGEGDG